jgi:5'-3' exonuclease
MGVKDFHKDFLGRDTHDKDEAGVPKHSLDDLEAESVVAVDVMSSLYKALKTVPAANAFDTRPPIPLTPAVSQLKKGDLGTLLGYREDLKFIIVLDGADHEAKEIEHRYRSNNRKDAQVKLEKLYSDGFENTIPDIESLRKKVVTV